MSDTVTIEKLVFGGRGLAHLHGKACFVPLTAPGDEVSLRLLVEKRSHLEAEMQDVLHPAECRVTPPCPVFGTCGGCDWQHIDYARQLHEKQRIYSDFLRRSAGVSEEAILPMVAAPAPYGYRCRIQLKIRDVAGRLHMGFYRTGSHFVVDFPDYCAIASNGVNRLIPRLRALLADYEERAKIPQIDISVGDDDRAILIFHYIGSDSKAFAEFLARALHRFPPSTGCYIQTGRKTSLLKISGLESLEYSLPAGLVPGMLPLELSFSRGGFSQVNYRQNLTLISLVGGFLKLTGTEKVLDLYCGNGNFSLPLAHAVGKVSGIEAFDGSVADACRNSVANGIVNTFFSCEDAASGVKRLATAGEKFDIVLLDPPRNGAREIVEYIPALAPRAVVYVSCDPATLARDVGLLRKCGYTAVKSCPVDMFPQTYHIESVTLLQPVAAHPT
jgi:23S rRNA (uracil1939-C5)-methyltransferase